MKFSGLLSLSGFAAVSTAAVVPRQSEYVGYLASTFLDSNPTVLQYLSNDNSPYSFRALNGGDAVLTSTVGTKAVRDIFVATNSARSEYFTIATDLDINAEGFSWDQATRHGSLGLVIWKSDNLVDWTGGDLVTVEGPTGGMAWAPSAVWNEEESQYYVFWATRLFDAADTEHTGTPTLNRIRYATTTDFATFSEPQDYLVDPEIGLIDQEFQYLGQPGHYLRYLKDENLGRVYAESTTDGIFGSWTRIPGYVTDEFSHEGAASFQDNVESNRYHVWIDDYSEYVPYESTDILNGAWTPASREGYPTGLKHGSITPLTQEEYDAIAAKYPE